MTLRRRFEREAAGKTEYREIRQEGIRCFLRWGVVGGSGTAMTSTRDDEQAARRHVSRKAAEWKRKGFVEVEAEKLPLEAEPDHDIPVTDAIIASTKPYAPVPDFHPVEGLYEVYCHEYSVDRPWGFYEYLVLRDEGRGAVHFNVSNKCHDTDSVYAFLEFVCAHRDLAFDGRDHHKLPLPKPIGRFSHALFCSPALGQTYRATPSIADRVALAFPIFDCEIGDADSEVLVDARIRSHDQLHYSDWNREPRPVIDLRFDVHPTRFGVERTFKVYGLAELERLLQVLPGAASDSWVEIRSYSGEIMRLSPLTVTNAAAALADVTSFVNG